MKLTGQLPVETHTCVSAPPTAAEITGAILAYLDVHGYEAWRLG